MNKKQLLIQVLIRYAFFAINLYLTTRLVRLDGWGIFPVLFAFFGTKDFVQASQLAKIYFQLNNMNKK